MKPSQKSEAIEQLHKDTFGFDRRALIKSNKCAPKPIGCGGDVVIFDDDLSRKEYTLSGLCQSCQDKFFGKKRKPRLSPLQPVIGPNDFITDGYQMFSGQEDAQCRRYKKVEDKEGNIWLYAIQEAAAENVYFHNPRDTKSEGFGGSTLSFALEDGSTYQAKGPWHSSADGLFKATGIDLRNTHRTFVVLAMEREYTDTLGTILRGVVYKDEKPMLGSFYRYKDLIKQYPQAKFYYSSSHGGSSCGPIN